MKAKRRAFVRVIGHPARRGRRARLPGRPHADIDTPQRKQSPTHLAWLDLQMTGLDAQVDVILQAALIITNAELTPLEQFCCDPSTSRHRNANPRR